jgi:hypothetical protein
LNIAETAKQLMNHNNNLIIEESLLFDDLCPSPSNIEEFIA